MSENIISAFLHSIYIKPQLELSLHLAKWCSLELARSGTINNPRGGAFALYIRPHRGAFVQLKCPHPRGFAIQERNANAWRLAQGGGGGMGAAEFDWCIIIENRKGRRTLKVSKNYYYPLPLPQPLPLQQLLLATATTTTATIAAAAATIQLLILLVMRHDVIKVEFSLFSAQVFLCGLQGRMYIWTDRPQLVGVCSSGSLLRRGLSGR